MAININQVGSGQNASSSGAKKAEDGSKAVTNLQPGASAKSGAQDTLTVTSDASRLLELEKALSGSAPVDSSRVDGIRHQLNAGTYEIDSNVIAKKLVASEQELS